MATVLTHAGTFALVEGYVLPVCDVEVSDTEAPRFVLDCPVCGNAGFRDDRCWHCGESEPDGESDAPVNNTCALCEADAPVGFDLCDHCHGVEWEHGPDPREDAPDAGYGCCGCHAPAGLPCFPGCRYAPDPDTDRDDDAEPCGGCGQMQYGLDGMLCPDCEHHARARAWEARQEAISRTAPNL